MGNANFALNGDQVNAPGNQTLSSLMRCSKTSTGSIQSKKIDRNTPNNCFNPNNPYPHQIVILTRFAFFFIVCVYRLVSHQSVYDVFSL